MTTFRVAILRGDELKAGGLELPELRWLHGYPYVLGIMATIAPAMLAWFCKKGWLRGNDPPPRRHHGLAERP
jgi:hypothetical protein